MTAQLLDGKELARAVKAQVRRAIEAAVAHGAPIKHRTPWSSAHPTSSDAVAHPVPGGVGPMTVAVLMHNTLQAAQMRHGTPR